MQCFIESLEEAGEDKLSGLQEPKTTNKNIQTKIQIVKIRFHRNICLYLNSMLGKVTTLEGGKAPHV